MYLLWVSRLYESAILNSWSAPVIPLPAPGLFSVYVEQYDVILAVINNVVKFVASNLCLLSNNYNLCQIMYMYLLVLPALKHNNSIEVMTRLLEKLIHSLRNTINYCFVSGYVCVQVI